MEVQNLTAGGHPDLLQEQSPGSGCESDIENGIIEVMTVKESRDVEAKESPENRGVALRWVVGQDDGAPRFAMRVIEVQPGQATPHHEHWWEHEVYVLSGTGIVTGADGEHEIHEGSVVYVPGDEKHQFRNTGEEALRFICVVPHMDRKPC